MARDRSPVPVVYGPVDERASVREVLARHSLPWIPLPLLLLAGLLAHLAWGHSTGLPLITAGLAVAAGGVAAGAWSISKKHGAPVGAHVASTVATAGLWLLLATTWGLTGVTVSLWVLAGASFALSWNVRMAIKPRRQEGSGEPKSPRAAGRALMAALGVKGTDMLPNEVGPARVAGVLELDGTHTIDDVQKRAHNLAAAVGAPRSGVRINADPADASRGDFSVTLRDVMGESTPWPGPSHVDGTPFDPVPMGLDETGQVRAKTIADPAGAKHELVQGMTGAGKSSGTKIELCELMPRRETGIIVIDTVKGIQTFGPAAPGLSKLVISEKLAVKVIKRLKSHVIRARTDFLGAHDLSEWKPGCGLTFLQVQVEEAATFLADMDDDEIKGIVRAARSAGIRLVLSLQRPSHDEISTTVRSQFGSITCYGMQSDDPVCLLPDEVQDAGADPRRFGDKQPGCNYCTGTGISTAQASTPLRNYNITVDVMREHAATYGPRMDPVDPTTVAAFGPLWEQLGDPVDVVARAKAKALGGPAHALPGHIDDEDDDMTPGTAPDTTHDEDELLPGAAELVVTSQFGSTSMLQRKLRVSFAIAGRLMDALEQHGVVGPPQGSKAREVLIPPAGLPAALAAITGDPAPTSGEAADTDDGDDDEDNYLTEEDMGVHTPDPDPDLRTSIDDPIDPIDVEIPFGKAGQEVDTDEARVAVAARIDELEQAGADTVRATDFADLVTSGMRSRAWFRKELLRLVEKVGRLTDEGGGVFGIVPSDPDDQDDDSDEEAA
jgi:hypothetical protein